MSNSELNVTTPIGKLTVMQHYDPDYPGFLLLLNGQQAGVFEYNRATESIQLHVWEQADGDTDPHTFTITETK
jgi:hypothetical protein